MKTKTAQILVAVLMALMVIGFFMWVGNANACDTCIESPVEAVQGDAVYGNGGAEMFDTDTRAMTIPTGFRMTRIQHPPKFVCTEYPQPDTFELKPIARARAVVPVVSQAQEDALKLFLEGQKQ